jgi:hypothetical protein
MAKSRDMIAHSVGLMFYRISAEQKNVSLLVSLFVRGDRALRQFPVRPIYFPVRGE